MFLQHATIHLAGADKNSDDQSIGRALWLREQLEQILEYLLSILAAQIAQLSYNPLALDSKQLHPNDAGHFQLHRLVPDRRIQRVGWITGIGNHCDDAVPLLVEGALAHN